MPRLNYTLHSLTALCHTQEISLPQGSKVAGTCSGIWFSVVQLQLTHTPAAVAGDMECTSSTCSPPNPPAAKCKGGRGRGSSPLGWAGKGEYRAGLSESSPSGGEFPALPAPPLGGVRRFSGGSTAASRLKAPPPLTAIPDNGPSAALTSHPPHPCSPLTFLPLAGGSGGRGGDSTPLGWDGKGEYRDGLSESSTTIPSHLSPVAMQGGTHTGRMGGGLPGKESPGAAAAALCSLSRLTVKFPQPLACLAMSCVLAGILTLHALPHLPHLPLETVPLVGTASHAADPLTSALRVCLAGGGEGQGSTPTLPHAPPRWPCSLKEGGSTAAMAKQRHPYSNLPPPSLPPPTSQQPEASWRSERLW
ncbi:unnamed protein product [Closterium sp. NIES-64]|nr:unnamed protein product [Closterium sp. NIES-64]